MSARIFRPSRNPMQSGKGKSKNWVLIFEQETAREIEPLLGHSSSSDTQSQIRLNFETLEAAIAYADKNDISYKVDMPHEHEVKKVSYPDNFKHDRKSAWTH
jgi:hypothetical protein